MFKLKDNFKGFIVVDYKWVLWLKLATFCMIVAAVYALVSLNMDVPKPANAVQPLENNRLSETQKTDKTDGTKLSVVKWMKNRSVMPEQVLSLIYDEAARHTHPNLILAICAVESSFNPGVESEKGAVGLMGILPGVWVDELKRHGVIQDKGDLYLIPNNIASGVFVLRKYLSKYKNVEDALFNYVGGDSNYANKVLRTLGEIHLAEMPGVSEIRAIEKT